MPLVWAHAEHVKLMRSLRVKNVFFDMPPQARISAIRSKAYARFCGSGGSTRNVARSIAASTLRR